MIDLTGNLTAVDTSSVKNQIIYELKKVGGTQTLYISDGNVTVHPTDLYGTYKGTLILNVYVWYHIRPQCNQQPECSGW